jgi:hypothetical protein
MFESILEFDLSIGSEVVSCFPAHVFQAPVVRPDSSQFWRIPDFAFSLCMEERLVGPSRKKRVHIVKGGVKCRSDGPVGPHTVGKVEIFRELLVPFSPI